MHFNLDDARRFLALFSDDGVVTFQVFDDSKRTAHAGHFSGDLDAYGARLQELNQNQKFGVYFCVNETDHEGRSEKNVKAVRALFLDLDGTPLTDVLASKTEPHAIVESSPGRYQVFYLVSDCPLDRFRTLQKRLAFRFSGDTSVCDLPRVMRVPGFYHQKADPFLVRLIRCEAFVPYKVAALTKEFGLDDVPAEVIQKDEGPLTPIEEIAQGKIAKGERHLTLLRYASKYAHQLALPPPVIRWIVEGMNREVCIEPVPQADLIRIVGQADEYAARERTKVIEYTIDTFQKKGKLYEKLPEKLFNPPGLVGDVYRYILDRAVKKQPELALAAAFVACGTIMGRKVRTETDLRTNLYFLSLIDSGAGKDWPRKAVRRIFNEIGLLGSASTEEVTSDTALVEVASATPSCIIILDEIGKFMRTVNRHDAAPHVAGIVTTLLKLYSSASEPFAGKSFADPKKNKTVQQPNVSVLATSVPDNFYRSITTEAAIDGFLNRFLFVQSHDPDPVLCHVTSFDPPNSILNEFLDWQRNVPYREGSDLGMTNAVLPAPRLVKNSPLATQIFQDFEETLRARRKIARKDNMHAMFVRASEAANRIALILACGEDKWTRVIEGSHAEYACEFVMNCTENLVTAVKTNVADTQHQSRVHKVISIIRAHMPDGVALTQIGDKAGLPRKELKTLLEEMEDSGKISSRDVKTSTKPARVYYAASAPG